MLGVVAVGGCVDERPEAFGIAENDGAAAGLSSTKRLPSSERRFVELCAACGSSKTDWCMISGSDLEPRFLSTRDWEN